MIRFGCPVCNKVIKAPDEGAGRKFPCPRCGQLLVIPAPLHLKKKALLGLLLPEPAIPAVAVASVGVPVAVQEGSAVNPEAPSVEPTIEKEPSAEGFDQTNEPPPVRLGILVEEPPPATSLIDEPLVATSPLSQSIPNEQSPELRHSVTGITTTIGAGVMFVAIFIFMLVCQSKADDISRTPGVNLVDAQEKLDTLNAVAKVIGISSIIFSSLWLVLSLRSQTKKLWIIVGSVANGLLLVWILFNPMAVTISTPKAAATVPLPSQPSPKRDHTQAIPKGDINPPPRQPPEQDREPRGGPVVIRKPQYLSDMEEFDVMVTQGPPGVDRFAKNGNLGYGEGDARYAKGKIRVKGKESPHGLSLCPASNTYAGVKYKLDKKALTFITSAALNDTVGAPGSPPGVGNIPTPLTFEVWGDGRLLWQSQPVNKGGIVQECSVSVLGVDVLDLRMQCPGDCTNASGVWVEPRVSLK